MLHPPSKRDIHCDASKDFTWWNRNVLIIYLASGYRKEPDSVTVLNLFTFFRADLIQPQASWKLSSTSDWLMPS